MPESTLARLLSDLSRRARLRGWSDAEWARRAGVPKETLCRLRARATCELATVEALAAAVGAELRVVPGRTSITADGRWPRRLERAAEDRLLDVLASGSRDAAQWRALGPPFFVAGLAVLMASLVERDRSRYLALAEALHPGSTTPEVFALWLAGTPVPPSRLVPRLRESRGG